MSDLSLVLPDLLIVALACYGVLQVATQRTRLPLPKLLPGWLLIGLLACFAIVAVYCGVLIFESVFNGPLDWR